jgi:hypothetical protein
MGNSEEGSPTEPVMANLEEETKRDWPPEVAVGLA